MPDSGEHLRAILDSLPSAVTSVAPDGTILFVNKAAAANLGCSPEEARGKSLRDFFPDQFVAVRGRLQQVVASKRVVAFEAVVTLPDGRKRYFNSDYCPTLDRDGNVSAIQIVATDLTIQRQTPATADADETSRPWALVSDDLSMTEDRLRAILDNAPIVVSVFDRDMTIRYMNRVATGRDIDEIVGRSVIDWIAPESRQRFRETFERVLEQQTVAECEVKGETGSWLVRLAPLIDAGEVKQVLGCTLDVTEKNKLQEQLAQRHRLESLGTMASGIAHDFNNLLHVIINHATLARMALSGASACEQHLEEVDAAASRAADLCAQMLDFAARGRETRGAASDLNGVIREVATLNRAAVDGRIRLEYELEPDLPPTRCSASKLSQVVLNLINNAAEAIGADHGDIKVTTALVTHSGDGSSYVPRPPPPGTYVQLRVSDSGPGLDVADRQRIFEPFYSTKSTGHGLGLSVVLGILSTHGAAITADGGADGGTVMTVLFPGAECRAEAATSSRQRQSFDGAGGTVMVVDDEDSIRRVTSKALAKAGYKTLVAEDGDTALALVARREGSIDAIVLDVTMPVRDGLSTLCELRRSHPRLPVVLLSGKPLSLTSPDPWARTLHKPCRMQLLLEQLAKLVEKARSARAANGEGEASGC